MRTVYTAADPVMAGFIENLLKEAGIPAYVAQAGLYGAAGEIPPTECWGRVMVVHEAQAEQARELIVEYLEGEPEHDGKEWKCSRCGERIEPQFTQCWNCGRERR
ncbi:MULTISPECIES: DUF2007 domain-containing protein [unclassified Thioalkalivibrio]|uniref:putative signal transducing protein n=1 Tax=unclassified Thioalkalivibrio TaxID=2621013 RepID=UPI000371184E|nr:MULTISPECIES: DUF2007 domain-containing protein [unclassified Thioalkalivibrio]